MRFAITPRRRNPSRRRKLNGLLAREGRFQALYLGDLGWSQLIDFHASQIGCFGDSILARELEPCYRLFQGFAVPFRQKKLARAELALSRSARRAQAEIMQSLALVDFDTSAGVIAVSQIYLRIRATVLRSFLHRIEGLHPILGDILALEFSLPHNVQRRAVVL